MPIVSHKKIQHLSRYFGILGFLCLLGYGYTAYSYYFLALIGPSFFITYWLRIHAGFLASIIPNEPLYNNILILVGTLLYFGLVGFQIKNILNERGKIRLLVLAIFLGFLVYIHRLAFQELSLYWSGREELTHPRATSDASFGDEKSQSLPVGGGEEHPLGPDTADQSRL